MPSRLSSSVRVYVHTLGCPKNEADSWRLARRLRLAGAELVSDPEEATHILVNTCGFIDAAKEESIEAILEVCDSYPQAAVIAVGCLVQRYGRELQKGIPEVASWFGVLDQLELPKLMASLGLSGQPGGFPGEKAPLNLGRSYAYLKISDGCDEPCTFCAIPAIKGPYRAFSAREIIEEAERLVEEGARELVLVGQDTAVWKDGRVDLPKLVELLARDERVSWIRVMYLQPEHVSRSLLERLAAQPKWCRYLDIPFQHSHPVILQAMGRSGERERYLELLRAARRFMPEVAVRSTFIVGFPGEREEHFRHLLEFVEEAMFAYAGGFIYSPQEGTPAAAFRPRVRRSTAVTRLNRLSAVLADCSLRFHQGLIGSRVRVMVDSLDAEDLPEGAIAVGRTMGQAPEVDGVTYLEGRLPGKVKIGEIVEATVTEAVGYDLVAVCDAA